ncbi:MAG: hypothetical protein JOZ24_13165 [Candidatus Eremiobacteraeota bacterium]|nr:hypothetical protein [Candidatus Eremiobacteraeota bacterium]
MQTTDVRQAAQGAVDQSKSFVNRQVDQRTTQLGDQIGGVADDLRGIADNLRQNETIGIAGSYVEQGADLIDGAAQYLRDADADRLMMDIEGLARRQPWACAAGALVIGFAASRFLKTSSTRRYLAGVDSEIDARTGAYG